MQSPLPANTVMLVDTGPALSEGLRAQLSANGLTVLAQERDLDRAIDACALLRPDAVLVNLSMPRARSLSLISELKQRLPGQLVLAYASFGKLSEHSAAAAGADAALTLQTPPSQLVQDVRSFIQRHRDGWSFADREGTDAQASADVTEDRGAGDGPDRADAR